MVSWRIQQERRMSTRAKTNGKIQARSSRSNCVKDADGKGKSAGRK